MSGVQRVEVAHWVQPAEGSTWLCSCGCLLLHRELPTTPGYSTQAAPSTPEPSNPCKLPEVPILDESRWWIRY